MLVASAVVGIVASSAVGIAYALGSGDWAGHAGEPRALFGLVALPFAGAMAIGAGIYNMLVFNGRRRSAARRAR